MGNKGEVCTYIGRGELKGDLRDVALKYSKRFVSLNSPHWEMVGYQLFNNRRTHYILEVKQDLLTDVEAQGGQYNLVLSITSESASLNRQIRNSFVKQTGIQIDEWGDI